MGGVGATVKGWGVRKPKTKARSEKTKQRTAIVKKVSSVLRKLETLGKKIVGIYIILAVIGLLPHGSILFL